MKKKLGKIGYSVGDATLEVRESLALDLLNLDRGLQRTGWTAGVEHLVLKRFPDGAEVPRYTANHYAVDDKGRTYAYRSGIVLGRSYRTQAAARKALEQRLGIDPNARWVEDKHGDLKLRVKGSKYPELKRWARWYLKREAAKQKAREKRIAARRAG